MERYVNEVFKNTPAKGMDGMMKAVYEAWLRLELGKSYSLSVETFDALREEHGPSPEMYDALLEIGRERLSISDWKKSTHVKSALFKVGPAVDAESKYMHDPNAWLDEFRENISKDWADAK